MRNVELLRAAADELEAGDSPFGPGFLRSYEVTSDECLDMAEHLATGARIVAKAIEEPRSAQGMGWLLTIAEGH